MNKQKLMTAVLLVLAGVFLLSACAEKETPTQEPVADISLDFVVAEGHVLPTRDIHLNFSAQGRVEEIRVQEGERVAQGQVLMQLADREGAEASLRTAELELIRAQQDHADFLRTTDLAAAEAWQTYLNSQLRRAEAERDWEDLNLDRLEEAVDDARIEVREREEDLEDAREELDKYQDVDEENQDRQAADDEVEEAEEELNEARRDLEKAVRDIDSVRAALDAALAAEAEAQRDYELLGDEGSTPDQQAILKTRLSAAEAGLKAARARLDSYTLTAPFAGTVTDVYLEAGQFVGPDAPALQLADLSEFRIETSDLTELEVVKIIEGQTVEIAPDALPGTSLTGQVDRISQSFQTQAGDIIYTVIIRLDETDPDLRWGMTVEVTFPTE